jgi:hypothetical protein
MTDGAFFDATIASKSIRKVAEEGSTLSILANKIFASYGGMICEFKPFAKALRGSA